MLGDTAVAVNQRTRARTALRGKHVRLPIVNREIPIIEDEYVVMPAQVRRRPRRREGADGDRVPEGHARARSQRLRHRPPAQPGDDQRDGAGQAPSPTSTAGATSATPGFLLGKSREDARTLVVDWFKKNGLLEDIKPYKHSVGHSYRSHVPIEPYLSDQWYCKVTGPRAGRARLRAMADDSSKLAKANSTKKERTLPPSTSAESEQRGLRV
jgi:valyl-tRNA synthetase